MFISRKRFEEELNKARESGFNQAMEQRYMDDRFREISERIDRLADTINKPITVPGFWKDVTPGA